MQRVTRGDYGREAVDVSSARNPRTRDSLLERGDALVALLHRWRWLALALVVAPTVGARLWLIHHFPEPDLDAKGHLGIARALLHDPTNVSLHWVWLPAYHFVLAALMAVGVTGQGVRILNCALAVLVPALVLLYAESERERGAGARRWVPWMAAAMCAISPLVNLLGTSAQQETLYTLLVVGAVWAADRDRFAIGGALLAVAALVRYETWGAMAMVVALQALGAIPAVRRRAPAAIARACRYPLSFTMPSVVALFGWFLAHRVTEGSWLGFLRELYRYTHVQRDDLHLDTASDLLGSRCGSRRSSSAASSESSSSSASRARGVRAGSCRSASTSS